MTTNAMGCKTLPASTNPEDISIAFFWEVASLRLQITRAAPTLCYREARKVFPLCGFAS